MNQDEALDQSATEATSCPETIPSVPPSTTEALEELLSRHGQEARALNARIIQMKKSAPKSKKRQVAMQIFDLESDLKFRHENELREFNEAQGTIDTGLENHTLPPLQDLSLVIEDENPVAPTATPQIHPRKPNKAKLKKQRKEEEFRRQLEEAVKERENQPDMAAAEQQAIEKLLPNMHLSLHHIPPDGHCLYNAIADQLEHQYQSRASYQDLRKEAAAFMREHPDDFMPFLETEDGDMYSKEAFSTYCDRVANTAEWGGELEILALSRSRKLPITIVQMEGPVLKINDDLYPDTTPLRLTYHKHMYALGAHYNSLRQNSGD